jgi:hypothetical protein
MEKRGIPTREVKEQFLLDDAFKPTAESHSRLSREQLEDAYSQLQSTYQGMTEEQLNEQIPDKDRLKRYDSMDWYATEVELDKLGSWPKMDGLDVELTTGNIVDVAERMRKVRANGLESQLKDPETFRRISQKTKSIAQIYDFTTENQPLILFPGGEVRESDYNTWVRNEKNGEPLCEIYDHDIDAGNSRALAYAELGLTTVPALVGEYKNK